VPGGSGGRPCFSFGITAKMTSKHGSRYHLDSQTTGFE